MQIKDRIPFPSLGTRWWYPYSRCADRDRLIGIPDLDVSFCVLLWLMDTYEISRRLQTIKLSKTHEDHKITLDVDTYTVSGFGESLCLFTKVLSTKLINRDAFRRQMARILLLLHKVEINFCGRKIISLWIQNKVWSNESPHRWSVKLFPKYDCF